MSTCPPTGWPRISSSLFYDDASAAIDWLVRAFGFEIQLRVDGENGQVLHSQLIVGDGLIMVGSAGRAPYRKSPQAVGGANTQCLFTYVQDIEGHCQRARAAGAKILTEPTTTDHGADYWADRGYEAEDPEGHHWFFAERLRGPQ